MSAPTSAPATTTGTVDGTLKTTKHASYITAMLLWFCSIFAEKYGNCACRFLISQARKKVEWEVANLPNTIDTSNQYQSIRKKEQMYEVMGSMLDLAEKVANNDTEGIKYMFFDAADKKATELGNQLSETVGKKFGEQSLIKGAFDIGLDAAEREAKEQGAANLDLTLDPMTGEPIIVTPVTTTLTGGTAVTPVTTTLAGGTGVTTLAPVITPEDELKQLAANKLSELVAQKLGDGEFANAFGDVVGNKAVENIDLFDLF